MRRGDVELYSNILSIILIMLSKLYFHFTLLPAVELEQLHADRMEW